MSEVICPNCKKAFTIDESSYAAIVKQVRDEEFSRELERFLDQQKRQSEADKALAVKEASDALKQENAQLAAEVARLNDRLDAQQLGAQNQLEAAVAKIELELNQKIASAQAAADRLRAEMDAQKKSADAQVQLAVAQAKTESLEAKQLVERQLAEAQHQLVLAEADAKAQQAAHSQELAIRLQAKQDEIDMRDRTIASIQNMRRELSVKMLGENLEQYCENQFNALRPTAFQSAQFEKDNDASSGSKGDYIYREVDAAGNEIISIMFEMKTETEEGTVKKKNADHFAKLDKDRTKKNCEYAVLVSELEIDNDLYESITDVSYMSGFDKMYVIRPKSFIAMITILRNQALKSQDLRQQLMTVKQRDIDVTHFEEKLDEFKQGFTDSCRHASDNFERAIKDIDDTIKKLEKIKEELRKSGKHLNTATNKLGKLTRRSLSHGNPTVAAAFKDYDKRLASGEVDPYVPLATEDWDDDTIQAELVDVEDN